MASSSADVESQKLGTEPDRVAEAPSEARSTRTTCTPREAKNAISNMMAAMTPRTPRPSEIARFLLSASFAALAGYADVVSVRIYGLFATMMTGNAFMLGSNAVSGIKSEDTVVARWAIRLTIMCAYCLGILAFDWLSQHVKKVGAATILAPIIAVGCLVLDYFVHMQQGLIIAMALIFGIQHGVSDNGLGGTTTMVTGHLTKLARAGARLRSCGDIVTQFHANLISIAAVVFIIIGGAIGEIMHAMYESDKITFTTLLAPVGPIMAVLLVINDHIFHKGEIDICQVLEDEGSYGAAATGSAARGLTKSITRNLSGGD